MSKSLYSDTLVTGCFDIVHVGHIALLEYAASFGLRVIVGLNDDVAVRALKGDGRPVNKLRDRMILMAAIKYVGYVFPIHSTNVAETIMTKKPTFWIKGGDYGIKTLNVKEREAARKIGVHIRFAPLIRGVSTTKILAGK